MKDKAEDLRGHLFEALERIKEAKGPKGVQREVAKSKAVVEVAGKLIDLAKVEIVARRELGESQLPEFIGGGARQLTGPAKR